MKTTIRKWLQAYYVDGSPILGDVYFKDRPVTNFSTTTNSRGSVEVVFQAGDWELAPMDHEIEVRPNLTAAADLIFRLADFVQTWHSTNEAAAEKLVSDARLFLAEMGEGK